ncbi:MAG TPA: NAD-dependent epimerase/dehydratase family protein [Candidatus Polarisedimenticolaceae bacterium]
MKVFVTGATGYIGYNVARAFRRAGHEVVGLARSEGKARRLVENEIRPVIGTLQDASIWRPVAESASVLIHAAVDYQADTVALDRATVATLLDAAKHGPGPKTVVYTSGVWVSGDTGTDAVDETSVPHPPALVAHRPEVERSVLAATHAKGLVLRPGLVYGHQGGLTGLLFAGAVSGGLSVVGDGRNRWAMVHVDDLAEGYVRAVESGLGGELFHFTDRSRHTVNGMAGAAARAAGYTGPIEHLTISEAAKSYGPMAECLALDQHVDSRKAVRLLGWQPRHGGFVDEVATYLASWRAAQA